MYLDSNACINVRQVERSTEQFSQHSLLNQEKMKLSAGEWPRYNSMA